MLISKINVALCIGGLTFFLNACAETDPVLEPTGKAAFVPADNVPFTQYVSDSQKNIEQILNTVRPSSVEKQPYLGNYTLQEAAAMRSPFQVPKTDNNRCNSVAKGAEKGFLLVHGLTDSPYLMSSISASLSQEYPCALIRAVLLPGHGTVVGDTLKMKHKDWEDIVNYGVNSFKSDSSVSNLYLVGFSTGTSLAINYMKQHPVATGKVREDKIKGLILLSVAVKAHNKLAALSPIVAWFKNWTSPTFTEQDAARYESFSYNAGAQFYKLTADMADSDYALNIPVLMAVSADDETINAKAAREFFCYRNSVKRRALIWYQSIDPRNNIAINRQDTPELMCSNIIEVKLDTLDPKYKTVNLAHTALSIHPDDPHYGINGKYRNCKAYIDEPQQFNDCQGNVKNNIFGEKNVRKLRSEIKPDYDYLRRGSFNPDYKNLEARILCFTNEQCSTLKLLSSH